jgi:hypothetical protein
MVRGVAIRCVIVLAALAAACGKPVDLKQTLTMSDISAGYFDAGIVDGRNKLVPSVTFKLNKSIDDDLRPLSLNVTFKRLSGPGGAEEDFDESFIQGVTFNGNQTAPITVRPKAGYTGDPPQSRAEMLKNSQFRDMRVHVFAKHGSGQWTEIGQVDLPRQLIVQS